MYYNNWQNSGRWKKRECTCMGVMRTRTDYMYIVYVYINQNANLNGEVNTSWYCLQEIKYVPIITYCRIMLLIMTIVPLKVLHVHVDFKINTFYYMWHVQYRSRRHLTGNARQKAFCIRSACVPIPVLHPFCISSISVLYLFCSCSHTCSVSVSFAFAFAFPDRYCITWQ